MNYTFQSFNFRGSDRSEIGARLFGEDVATPRS